MLFVRIAVLLLLVLCTDAGAIVAAPIAIRFGHVVARQTPKGKAAEYFKRLVEQRSEGRVRVEISPDGQLGDEQQLLVALKNNSIQMTAPSLSKLTRVNQQLQLFDLPFLFRNVEHLHRVIDGEIGRKLLAETSKDGLVALCFWDNGFKQLTANRSLIHPDDAMGLKMRIEGSAVQKAQFEALGASTRTIPFPSLYEALRNGEADGQENTLSNIYSQKLFDVQTDLTISNHGYLEYLILTNETFWHQVPEDLRVIISGAIKDAAEYARDMAVEINGKALQELQATQKIRIHHLNHAEKELWQRQLGSIYQQFSPQIGEELVLQAQKR